MANTSDDSILGCPPGDLPRLTGLSPDGTPAPMSRKYMIRYIAVKLAGLAKEVILPQELDPDGSLHLQGTMELLSGSDDLLKHHRQMRRLLHDYQCPVDNRIQQFLDKALGGFDLNGPIKLPNRTFILDRVGLATEMSLPLGRNEFKNAEIETFRLRNGILSNSRNDKRTTKGSFHVAEYGLPIAADKKAVPLKVYGNILAAALNPPDEDMMTIPFTTSLPTPVAAWTSILLRPLVAPEVPHWLPEKRTEVRFFAPGGLVANLDFVERIFGNWGDPYLCEHDAALDPAHWTGTSGCVILAPWILNLKKKELGLPHVSEATDRQRRDGMCYEHDDDLYNDGKPYKITCRSAAGVMVTLLGDNYFGYCKKEVKTQIGFSANLFGLSEEEHAGGTLAFPSYNIEKGVFTGVLDPTNTPHLSNECQLGEWIRKDFLSLAKEQIDAGLDGYTFERVVSEYGGLMDVKPSGYAVDKRFPDIIYVPDNVVISLPEQSVTWVNKTTGQEHRLKLLPNKHYIHPTGYKVRLEKHPVSQKWQLIGTSGIATFCHKPCTVSGGGKSEISKSIRDQISTGPIYTEDLDRDLQTVQDLIDHDYSKRFKNSGKQDTRPLMSDNRSLGSVIKMLTPGSDYTDEHNAFVEGIPNRIRSILYLVKRLYTEQEKESWRADFEVDTTDGQKDHLLKRKGVRLSGNFLRIGIDKTGHQWQNYKLRPDFIASAKVQMEDDITASIVVPRQRIPGTRYNPAHPSLKISLNAEWRLFQRPDDAVIPGFDKQTEIDMSAAQSWCSNFDALDTMKVREIVDDVRFFDAFSDPMKKHLKEAAALPDESDELVVCSAKKRIMEDGTRSTNPRYLQVRSDVTRLQDRYIGEVQTRFHRMLPLAEKVVFPVNNVLSGRRNNIREPTVPALCCYGPIHFQKMPELFMDYITSVTGKSPSTTGFGSEGALTKGPFNALRFAADLNSTFVSLMLTGYHGYSTAAGYIGPNYRVDHDVSLLIPEIWCRLSHNERNADEMIKGGYLEELQDFDYDGRKVLASRLGYRITGKFVSTYFGRVFENPDKVFTEEMLKPELQDLANFVEGVDNLMISYERTANLYLQDGTVEDLIPPLKALVHIMATGAYEGKDVKHPDIQAMFTYESMMSSEWYKKRLQTKQYIDVRFWKRAIHYMEVSKTNQHTQHPPSLPLPLPLSLCVWCRPICQVL